MSSANRSVSFTVDSGYGKRCP